MGQVNETLRWIDGNCPGLVGEIVRWHGLYYVQGLGWPSIFESLCAEQLGEIAKHLGASDDVAAFSVWKGAEFLAGAVMDARPGKRPGTRLRFLIASDAARGQGFGNELLARAISWSEGRGDPAIWLTTVAGLRASAHLYQKFGFVMLEEQVDQTWGSAHHEQIWERKARTPGALIRDNCHHSR